ncbi:MAG: DUF4365 domain-containing protein [Shinella sp.]|uniref:DUF4365 domain-containing protein n=1 Tax=Shinella sp. TaxID=1870904 RepID=UPI003C717295
MPKRTRSHELEDESFDRFKVALPKRWVCREKDRDYGVDLEVEIFDDAGCATGLMFYVQLKATDDAALERKVIIQVDRLDYLAALGMPSIIVRYCASTERMFWTWNFNAIRKAKPDAETVTVSFETEWLSGTPITIEGTLIKLRRLREANRNEKFPLSGSYNLPFGKQLVAEAALSSAVNGLSFFISTNHSSSELHLTASFTEDELVIALDPIGFLAIPIPRFRREDVSQLLAFGLVAVLERMAFHERAATAARLCLGFDLISDSVSRELAHIACLTLKATPIEAAELAIKCGLHTQQDHAYAIFVTDLQLSGAGRGAIAEALDRFLRAAASAHVGSSKAAALYSLGNVYANNGQYARAIAAFNAARKAWKRYLAAPYFLNEIGGACFLARKFRCATAAYRAALELEYDENIAFCLADSLLFSGAFDESVRVMAHIIASDEDTRASEARLKVRIARWLSELKLDHPSIDVSVFSELAGAAETSNDHETRYLAALMVAFILYSNATCWSYAIQASLTCCQTDEILDVLVCANLAQGVDPYAICRELLLELVDTENELKEIDALAIRAGEIVKDRGKTPYRARLLNDDGSIAAVGEF